MDNIEIYLLNSTLEHLPEEWGINELINFNFYFIIRIMLLKNQKLLMPDQLDIMLSKLNGYISNVVFQGDCEPTLNPYLQGLADVARKYTEQVAIVTNEMMLTPERIDSLIASGVTWFALSIDDHREQIYFLLAMRVILHQVVYIHEMGTILEIC